MKIFRISIIALLFGMVLYLDLSAATIDEQISAIKSATPKNRVNLVNNFKKTLSTMSSNERANAIAQMRSNMNKHTVGSQTQNRTHQMSQSDSMQRKQQMNQKQTGSQAIHQGQGQGSGHKFMGNK